MKSEDFTIKGQKFETQSSEKNNVKLLTVDEFILCVYSCRIAFFVSNSSIKASLPCFSFESTKSSLRNHSKRKTFNPRIFCTFVEKLHGKHDSLARV